MVPAHMRPLEKLLSLKDAAETLGVTPKTLMAHVKAGRVASVDMGTGGMRQRRRFRPSDLVAFIEAQRTRCAPIEMGAVPAKKRRRASPATALSREVDMRVLLARGRMK